MLRLFLIILCRLGYCFFFSSRRRHTICALVTGVQTCALPICHNLDRVRTRAKEAFPDLTLAQVEALPLAERKAAGVILPYKIATLPFPYGFEQSHVML